jgi:Glycosyl hydrolase catalytic core
MTSTYTSINYVTMTLSSGTSTVSIGGNAQAFQESTAIAAATTSSASDAPVGFFQKSSQGGFGQPSFSFSAAGVSTTMATMFSSAAPAAASSAPPAASSSAPSPGGPSGGKKGLSYNSAALTSAFANSGMSWAYNWGSSAAGTLPSGVSYVPMLWGLGDVDSWASAAAAAISSGSSAALSFNEPDLSTQSNIDPVTAATNHIQYMNPLSVEVGSPAITNGAGTSPLMGIDWLNAFFTACDGKCKVDFVAFHWYSDASETAYFMQHVSDVIAAAAAAGVSKVWLTEFGVTGGDASTFLSTVMPFLESTTAVEKYAYFMCADPETLSGSSLNSVGEIYASTT